MRKLTYFIHATLDGYIAGPEGQYDFFPFEGEEADAILADFPETMPTPARAPLGIADRAAQRFDTVIMGRATYDPGLKVGMTSPYAHLTQYVVSRTLVSPDPAVTVVDDPVALVRELKKQDGMDVWLCGGGKLASALRDEIDELIIKREPIVIGSGIPLFDGPFVPSRFVPVATRSFDSGLTITTFSKDAKDSNKEAPAVHIITPSDDAVTVSPNATMSGLASPSRGSAELSTWTVAMDAGASGPEHSISREQVWTVTAGVLEVTCDGRTEKVVAGQTLVLPPDLVRRIHAPERAEAHVSMRADGVASVPGTEGTRELPWAR